MHAKPVSRRSFLKQSTLMATTLAAVTTKKVRAASPGKMPRICVFSKYLQTMDFETLAKACKHAGLDGIDLTVRKGGHVLPENVAHDLPRAVEAAQAQGLEVAMISTTLNDGADSTAPAIFGAAEKAGIRYVRVGGLQYDKTGNPAEQLPKFIERVRTLTVLAEKYKCILGYHNHSGYDNVGAPVWDLHQMFSKIGSQNLGSNFDVGHASVEGGYGAWQINARLMAPYLKMMAVKDFVWDKDKPRWVPLGEGVVKTVEFLKIARNAQFNGPISLHFEYKTPSTDTLLEHIATAARTLRGYLKEAGYET